MQKLYAMFPSGAPGAALLILRLAVVIYTLVSDDAPLTALPLFLKLIYGALLLLLALGCLTPLVSGICGALPLMLAVFRGGGCHYGALLSLANGVALTLLGPGAYSVDSILFGRRVTVLNKPRNHG